MSDKESSVPKQDPNNYWEQLERLEKLIRASELKAGVIFSFHGLILGVFFDRLEQLSPLFQGGAVFIVLACLWMTSSLISIFFCFKCFKPQITKKYEKNVLFFRDAVYSFGSIEKYSKKVIEIFGKDEEFYSQLSQQIYIESKIIDKKFKNVEHAIKYFAFSFIFIIIIVIVWFIHLYL
jgi:hypothetical protein